METTLTTEQKNEIILFYMGVLEHRQVPDNAPSMAGKKYIGINKDELNKLFTGIASFVTVSHLILTADYHRSYNSLMPVVKKLVSELVEEFNKEWAKEHKNTLKVAEIEFNISQIENTCTMCFNNITPLFEITVEFIQYLNTIKQTTNANQ